MIFKKSNFLLHTLLGAARWGADHLQVIHITQKYTEATNGHYLVRVETPENGDASLELPKGRGHSPYLKRRVDVCIPTDAAKNVAAAIEATKSSASPVKGLTWLGRNTAKDNAEFLTWTGDQFITVSVRACDVRYPKTEDVIRKSRRRKPKSRIGFSPELMGKLCAYLTKIGAKSVVLEIRGPDEAMVMKAKPEEGPEEVLVLLMPMKIWDEPKKLNKCGGEEPIADPQEPETGEKEDEIESTPGQEEGEDGDVKEGEKSA